MDSVNIFFIKNKFFIAQMKIIYKYAVTTDEQATN